MLQVRNWGWGTQSDVWGQTASKWWAEVPRSSSLRGEPPICVLFPSPHWNSTKRNTLMSGEAPSERNESQSWFESRDKRQDSPPAQVQAGGESLPLCQQVRVSVPALRTVLWSLIFVPWINQALPHRGLLSARLLLLTSASPGFSRGGLLLPSAISAPVPPSRRCFSNTRLCRSPSVSNSPRPAYQPLKVFLSAYEFNK